MKGTVILLFSSLFTGDLYWAQFIAFQKKKKNNTENFANSIKELKADNKTKHHPHNPWLFSFHGSSTPRWRDTKGGHPSWDHCIPGKSLPGWLELGEKTRAGAEGSSNWPLTTATGQGEVTTNLNQGDLSVGSKARCCKTFPGIDKVPVLSWGGADPSLRSQ